LQSASTAIVRNNSAQPATWTVPGSCQNAAQTAAVSKGTDFS
jgi:hypothetical protein